MEELLDHSNSGTRLRPGAAAPKATSQPTDAAVSCSFPEAPTRRFRPAPLPSGKQGRICAVPLDTSPPSQTSSVQTGTERPVDMHGREEFDAVFQRETAQLDWRSERSEEASGSSEEGPAAGTARSGHDAAARTATAAAGGITLLPAAIPRSATLSLPFEQPRSGPGKTADNHRTAQAFGALQHAEEGANEETPGPAAVPRLLASAGQSRAQAKNRRRSSGTG